ncbi:UvrD-helicase domain-containing protein [Zoogloea sp.]|uniref:UvrD-helicase domain-containing protein n=1 Tax=Zoogloea sp. TaxID=49181 RepID=UPI0035AEF298
MSIIVIDRKFLSSFDIALIDNSWFTKFDVPENSPFKKIIHNNNIYFVSETSDERSGFLFIKAEIFNDKKYKAQAFERIIRVALRHFDRNIAIPIGWQPYYLGRVLSIYACSNRGIEARIYIDQKPSDAINNIYAFNITNSPEDLNKVYASIDKDGYDSALSGLSDAILNAIENSDDALDKTQNDRITPVGKYGILLNQPEFSFSEPGTIDDWLQYRLNKNQINFVEREVNQPIRLRGAAGTGKTRAMAVKCLHELYKSAIKNNEDKTFAFITHSSALSQELIVDIFSGLDPEKKWHALKDGHGKNKLWIGTLYDLAQDHLSYLQKGLRPISNDGIEGRVYQRITIEQSVNKIKNNPRVAINLINECKEIHEVIHSTGQKFDNFVTELMGEFTGVLEAENIRKGTQEAEKYIKNSRQLWQMQLPTPNYRRLILEIYEIYCSILREQRYMSLDQMIADYSRYLTSHEWSQLREISGFDCIYIDEYHYFNSHESMLLHNLFKTRAQFDGRWPLIMAYDLKQNVSTSGLSGGIERFKNPGVGTSIPMDLSQNYRSTPEIVRFLSDVDAFFPALDLEGEYATYSCHTEKPSGPIPDVIIFDDDLSLIRATIEYGIKIAHQLGSSKKVAVLCLNEGIFDKYSQLGDLDKFIIIKSREDLKSTRYTRTRCIYSMPEYVAGLQFDTVIIIHADEIDSNIEHITPSMQRAYISRLYLGASRASQKLAIACSNERGGPDLVIRKALENNSVKKHEYYN